MQANFRNAIIVILSVLLLFVVFRAQSPAQGEAVKPVAKSITWEYQMIHPKAELLDSLGREGWEACTAYEIGNVVTVILNRQKIEK